MLKKNFQFLEKMKFFNFSWIILDSNEINAHMFLNNYLIEALQNKVSCITLRFQINFLFKFKE